MYSNFTVEEQRDIGGSYTKPLPVNPHQLSKFFKTMP
jgi:hypothetical protein